MARSRWICIVCAAVLCAMAALAGATPQTFGSRRLEIPQPDGYGPTSGSSAQIFNFGSAFLPPGNRLVEFYVVPADGEALLAGRLDKLPRYFQLNVPRSIDGKPVSTAEFRANAKTIESSVEAAMENRGARSDQIAREGNQRVQQRAGVDPGVSIDDIGYHGVFRREDWGIFFSMSSTVGATGTGSDRMFCAGAIALVDHQLLYFYTYAIERTPADRDWAKRALVAWVEAARAANPDDAAIEAAAAPQHVDPLVRILGLAIVGGLIGLVVAMIRRRRS
ncbi:MAG: hypothetical protein JNN30_02965 [Rhodanobacteraceae bacterium]|nr:hypothetical protein [Rhodanobacteraceae bacterium]